MVSPTGIRSKPLLGMQMLIAQSATFQAWVGASNTTEAMEHVHIYEADDRDDGADAPMPRAIVRLESGFSYNRIGVGTHNSEGTLSVSFQAEPYDATASLADQYTTFCNKLGAIIEECQEVAGYGDGLFEAVNEVQRVTFSAAPAYGQGTFSGPGAETTTIDFADTLAAEQAAFDSSMTGKSPTVARTSSLIHTFTFATGSYAHTNLTQMTFTPDTTTYPLNDGTSTATLVKTQAGDAGGGIPTIYTLTWVGAAGWVTISGTDFVRGSLPATANLGGFDFDIAGSGATFTLTTQQNTNATLTLDVSKVGAAVTGTMSTPTAGSAGTGESYLNVVRWDSDGQPPERCKSQHEGGAFYYEDNYIVRWEG